MEGADDSWRGIWRGGWAGAVAAGRRGCPLALKVSHNTGPTRDSCNRLLCGANQLTSCMPRALMPASHFICDLSSTR